MNAPGSDCVEHGRDQAETEFTAALRSIFASDSDVLAIAFVDHEGECVDYCGSLEPYEIRVIGAQLQVVLNNIAPNVARLGLGELAELHVHCENHELVVRRIDYEYACVVMRREGLPDAPMLAALDSALATLRRLAGLGIPPWDDWDRTLRVRVRESAGWGYAPDALLEGENELRIEGVIGRWEEHGGLTGQPLICFRIHTEDGRDSTLAHDAAHDRWYRWS